MLRLAVSILLLGVALAAHAGDDPQTVGDDIITGSVAPDTLAREIPAARQIIALYKSGRRDEGDAATVRLTNTVLKTAVEWALIRSTKDHVGTELLTRFMRANPDFPAQTLLRQRMENALLAERAAAGTVFDFFDGREPEMPAGRLLVAIHLRDKGFPLLAAAQIKQAWRGDNVSPEMERMIIDAFGDVLSEADHRYRALKLIYAGQTSRGIRVAERVSADFAKLTEQLAVAMHAKGSLQRQIDRVPPAIRHETAFALMQAIELRRTDRHAEAANLLAQTTTDPEMIVDGDEWWQEERALTRGLLDAGEARLAYRIASSSRAMSASAQSEAHFLAGFIALRLLKEPATADMQFLQSREAAADGTSIARALYWLGRSRTDLQMPSKPFFQKAAAFGETYYGQLAAAELGRQISVDHVEADPASRAVLLALPETAIIKALLSMGERELAAPLLIGLADSLTYPQSLDALADLVDPANDIKLLLRMGKKAIARGLPLIDAAFPKDGIPAFENVPNGPDRALVFAVARQESAFDSRAISRADARGLMQLLPSTARATAKRFGIPFTPADLIANPALNARLGAAHLSELKMATHGNIPMMLAAYNAGPRRMREWIETYGDPRDPAVDPVDWVERIPFTETRTYVQKVMENLQVYRARFAPESLRSIRDDLGEGQLRAEASLP